ncbi:thioredoxin domain-containing protein [Pigmentibacter sp. JX0631]|uniref:thioredoxin domain-containing protein n=1 Tax=Pigmentibacter sp. JX0631 TaxID=2976982 RepID=UPI002468FA21|nr:thioredoxin domain-containing protein [Pigmentibacter sp. JX0631]WGL61330.1 thioredoxin domain-containing protein [Pigmentibacter sp. JX0631]
MNSGKTNKLKFENSPYLLQHRDNPVNWYPWGNEAFQLAKNENKPIFLSIGYSTCHWCHVMAHESFEDNETAQLMNELFINIKVDREERPDIDEIYLEAVMLISQHGGWPLSVFLTPDLMPFYGGTYFPPESKGNTPAFKDVLKAIAKYYSEDKNDADNKSNKIVSYLKESTAQTSLVKLEEFLKDNSLSINKLENFCIPFYDKLLQNLQIDFDHSHGGFGYAPKFPQPSKLEALLYSKEMHLKSFAFFTLNSIRCGGIIDQIGGGISRYSVDNKWIVPHFEKMLYDNAQMLKIFSLAGFLLSNNNQILSLEFHKTSENILEYLERDLKCKISGLFFSAEDADSEGEEGTFYTFYWDEFLDIFKENSNLKNFALKYFNVTEKGNFEGKNILTISNNLQNLCDEFSLTNVECESFIKKSKDIIFDYRKSRERPSLDNKCILSWNSLLCTGLIKASITSNNFSFLEKGLNLLTNITNKFKNSEGYFHIYINGNLKIDPFLDDLSFLLEACCEALFITGSLSLLNEILDLIKKIHANYVDPSEGILFYSKNNENTICRPSKPEDNVIYSANSAIFGCLTKLNLWISTNDVKEISLSQQKMIDSLALIALSNTVQLTEKVPTASAQMLQKIKFSEHKRTLIIKNVNNSIPLESIHKSYEFVTSKTDDYCFIAVEKNNKYNLSELNLYVLEKNSRLQDLEYALCDLQGCKIPRKNIFDLFN